jgi:hypothetical protein
VAVTQEINAAEVAFLLTLASFPLAERGKGDAGKSQHMAVHAGQ